MNRTSGGISISTTCASAGLCRPVSDKDITLLVDAYRRLLPFLDLGGIQMGRRHEMLFLFGFDEAGPLRGDEAVSAKALKARHKLIHQVGKYTSQPAQRDKKAKFVPFADQAPRILETFRHLGYRHDRRYADDSYDFTNLSFWGMVLIGLLNKSTRTALVADMVEAKFDLPQRDKQIAILHRYVQAVLPDAEADETVFRALASRLRAITLERRNASESVALAEKLCLPFEEDEEWQILIVIPLRGSEGPALIARDAVRLHIRPDPDWQWQLSARVSARGAFSESEKTCFRNDLALPTLGRGNLHDFPAWLQRIRTESGLDFDTASADIRVGRKRTAAKRIAQWLKH